MLQLPRKALSCVASSENIEEAAIKIENVAAQTPTPATDQQARFTFHPTPLKLSQPPESTTPPKLYAISDLHISFPENRADLLAFTRPEGSNPHDGLILAGDIGERLEHLELAFSVLTPHFQGGVWWVPGNHELFSLAPKGSEEGGKGDQRDSLRGEAKYMACVAVAQKWGVGTPEDDAAEWRVWWDESSGSGKGKGYIVAPIFTLYDYSFCPKELEGKSTQEKLEWAGSTRATDEAILFPDPYASREEWCGVLCEKAERKLARAVGRVEREGLAGLIIVNHWPLRMDLVHIPRVPKFVLWCGTKRTEEWHVRYKASVVVSGHLHVRRTDFRDGAEGVNDDWRCRFEEVSLGYPKQWEGAKAQGKDIHAMMRGIIPGHQYSEEERISNATIWRKYNNA